VKADELDLLEALELKESGTQLVKILSSLSSKANQDILSSYHATLVSSYHWPLSPDSSSRIVIPGRPNVLKLKIKIPIILPSGDVASDNSYHQMENRRDLNKTLHSFPMEPAIASVSVVKSDYHWSEIDFVIDRNNLRKLFSWASDGFFQKSPSKRFRIDFEKFGKVIIAVRTDVNDSIDVAYGYRFKEACIEEVTRIETSYRALFEASFGPFNMLIRSTIDGIRSQESLEHFKKEVEESSDWVALPGSDLKYRFDRDDPPMKIANCVELKSMSKRHLENSPHEVFESVWPQMFFSGVPHMMLGIRSQDRIEELSSYTIDQVLSKCRMSKNDVNSSLNKMIMAMSEIKQSMSDGDHFSLLFEPTESEHLQLLRRPTDTASCLPSCSYYRELLG